jgi:hypothetical protein
MFMYWIMYQEMHAGSDCVSCGDLPACGCGDFVLDESSESDICLFRDLIDGGQWPRSEFRLRGDGVATMLSMQVLRASEVIIAIGVSPVHPPLTNATVGAVALLVGGLMVLSRLRHRLGRIHLLLPNGVVLTVEVSVEGEPDGAWRHGLLMGLRLNNGRLCQWTYGWRN